VTTTRPASSNLSSFQLTGSLLTLPARICQTLMTALLNNIDREWNHRTRLGLRLTEHQAERHSEPVVDVHLVGNGEVEVVLDDRLRNVSGGRRITDDLGHRARSQPSSAGLNSAAVPIAGNEMKAVA